MRTREQLEQDVRAEHSDWTDDQVKAEVDRLDAEQRQPAPQNPPDPDPDRDAAFARMRREKEEAEAKAAALEAEKAEAERKKAEDAGEWEKLAKAETARREAAEAETARVKAERVIEEKAKGLKFRYPSDALALLPADLDRSDQEKVQKALEDLATSRPDLIDDGAPAPSGGPPAGGGPPAPDPELTIERLRAMSPQQVAALDQEKVQAVLSSGGS